MVDDIIGAPTRSVSLVLGEGRAAKRTCRRHHAQRPKRGAGGEGKSGVRARSCSFRTERKKWFSSKQNTGGYPFVRSASRKRCSAGLCRRAGGRRNGGGGGAAGGVSARLPCGRTLGRDRVGRAARWWAHRGDATHRRAEARGTYTVRSGRWTGPGRGPAGGGVVGGCRGSPGSAWGTRAVQCLPRCPDPARIPPPSARPRCRSWAGRGRQRAGARDGHWSRRGHSSLGASAVASWAGARVHVSGVPVHARPRHSAHATPGTHAAGCVAWTAMWLGGRGRVRWRPRLSVDSLLLSLSVLCLCCGCCFLWGPVCDACVRAFGPLGVWQSSAQAHGHGHVPKGSDPSGGCHSGAPPRHRQARHRPGRRWRRAPQCARSLVRRRRWHPPRGQDQAGYRCRR